MNTDLAGYFDEDAYPPQLSTRLTPGWLSALTRRNGWAAPDPSGSVRILDIGCGDGIGLAMIAASHPEARVEGIDGMAAHIAAGERFATGIDNLHLTHARFDEALAAGGAPCDFVTAHGVLAWVTPEIRAQALDLVAARLAPGGICAVSYNAQPGWSTRLAYQHLIARIAEDADGTGSARYFAAHERVRALVDAGFDAVPAKVIDLFDEIAKQVHSGYFPHEFLAHGWQPLWGSEVRQAMNERGLVYLGQAEFERARPDLSLREDPRRIVTETEEPGLRDTLFDMALNSPFRIDIYGRDPVRAEDGYADVWFRAEADADARLAARTSAGTIRFDNRAARAMIEALQDGPATLRRLATSLDLGLPDICNAADCLALGRLAAPCAPPSPPEAARAANRRQGQAALRAGGPAIQVLAGRHGPVKANNLEIVLHSHAIDDILATLRSVPEVAARLLAEGVSPDDPDIGPELTAAQQIVRHSLARMGVPPADSGPSL